MQRLNVEFRSEGVALRGWLYLPGRVPSGRRSS